VVQEYRKGGPCSPKYKRGVRVSFYSGRPYTLCYDFARLLLSVATTGNGYERGYLPVRFGEKGAVTLENENATAIAAAYFVLSLVLLRKQET